MAEKSTVNEVAEIEAEPEVVLDPPDVVDDAPLLDFLDELPHAVNAKPVTRAVHTTPARFNDNLMLPPLVEQR